jgi:hypothetical protein
MPRATSGHPRRVDVEGQEPADLVGGGRQVTAAVHVDGGRLPWWVTSTSARDQSASTRNTVRIPSPARCPGSAAGLKPSQNARLVVSDHGPSTSTSTVCHLIALPSCG